MVHGLKESVSLQELRLVVVEQGYLRYDFLMMSLIFSLLLELHHKNILCRIWADVTIF